MLPYQFRYIKTVLTGHDPLVGRILNLDAVVHVFDPFESPNPSYNRQGKVPLHPSLNHPRGQAKQRGALKGAETAEETLKEEKRKEKMEETDIDTSIYEAVMKGYRYSGFGLGLGELAHIARQVETELDAWIVGLEKEKEEKY